MGVGRTDGLEWKKTQAWNLHNNRKSPSSSDSRDCQSLGSHNFVCRNYETRMGSLKSLVEMKTLPKVCSAWVLLKLSELAKMDMEEHSFPDEHPVIVQHTRVCREWPQHALPEDQSGEGDWDLLKKKNEINLSELDLGSTANFNHLVSTALRKEGRHPNV